MLQLLTLLQSTRDKTGVYVPTETYESMESELQLRRNQVLFHLSLCIFYVFMLT